MKKNNQITNLENRGKAPLLVIMKLKSLVMLCLWLGLLAIPLSSQGQSGCDGVRTIVQCQVTGCAEEPQSAEALLNRLKHKQARGVRPKELTFC